MGVVNGWGGGGGGGGGGGVRSAICAHPYFEILDPPLIILVKSPYNRVSPIRGKLSRI